MSPFSLIDIMICDEQTQARPIEFDNDDHDGTGLMKNGKYIIPIKFMTTCQFCLQLIEFTVFDMFMIVGSNKVYVDCKCRKATGEKIDKNAMFDLCDEQYKTIFSKLELSKREVIKPTEAEIKLLFQDPFEFGEFDYPLEEV